MRTSSLFTEIVELMAASDNVLNIGFIPSSDKDSTRLVTDTVTCTPQSPSSLLLESKPFHKGAKQHTTVYAVPFEEFSILHIEGSEKLSALSGPGIAIVTESSETTLNGQAAPRGSD
jgi:mannose-6-phosphate isomerase